MATTGPLGADLNWRVSSWNVFQSTNIHKRHFVKFTSNRCFYLSDSMLDTCTFCVCTSSPRPIDFKICFCIFFLLTRSSSGTLLRSSLLNGLKVLAGCDDGHKVFTVALRVPDAAGYLGFDIRTMSFVWPLPGAICKFASFYEYGNFSCGNFCNKLILHAISTSQGHLKKIIKPKQEKKNDALMKTCIKVCDEQYYKNNIAAFVLVLQWKSEKKSAELC